MIRIVKGIYGYRGSNGFIEPKNTKSAPFSLTAEKEEELVGKGVAEYVKDNPAEMPQEDEHEDDKEDHEGISIWDMGYNELKSYAKELGLPAKGTKEELLACISEKLDIPPNLTAEIPQ